MADTSDKVMDSPIAAGERTNFAKSRELQPKAHRLIPGGSHTYAKGDDQYPELSPGFLVRGKGCHVWDLDGNEYIEYGMGLRAVTLGHAFDPLVQAAYQQMQLGANFTRPAKIEVDLAEAMLDVIEGMDMVKFAKNGSDVTTAALKLARAYTGRDMVAICSDHPFFSVDDWFICTTAVNAGIPDAITKLTVKFRYNDIESLRQLFDQHPNQIACVVLEPETYSPPVNNYLQQVKQLCEERGAVMLLDETITGFRWHLSGAQKFHGVVPHLSTFGKGMGNGFSIAALMGRRDIMELGGLDTKKPRVFLLSTTHGAETHSLAASLAALRFYRQNPVIETMWKQGERLRTLVNRSIAEHKLEGYFEVAGRPCNMIFATFDHNKQRSQPFRTLFMQELIRRGVIGPSFVVSYSHSDADIDRTGEAVHGALGVYRKAIDEGSVDKYLVGRPVKPVYRQFN